MITALLTSVEPSPGPTGWVDPWIDLTPDEFPEPPPWMIPTFMTLFVLAILGGIFLWLTWLRRARQERLARREELRNKEWVSLAEFDPKKDSSRPRSPKVLRDKLDGDDD